MNKKKENAATKKVAQVLHEFKEARLHIGRSGTIVTDRKQALAIALSEAAQFDHAKKT